MDIKNKRHRIGIIGAGISGLSFAYYCKRMSRETQQSIELKILEKSDRAGGIIQTHRKSDYILEQGPDCFLAKDNEILKLIEALELDSELVETIPEFRKSFIYKKGKLRPVPTGLYLMAPKRILPFLWSPLLSIWGKCRVLMEPFVPRRLEGEDESLADFVTRRFGKEMLERIAQPMVAGIYTADPKELSVRACMPQFVELEQKYGSIIRGLRKENQLNIGKDTRGPRYGMFLSFRHGMETLTRCLADQVKDVSYYNMDIVSIEREGEAWRVCERSGKTFIFDEIVISGPSNGAANLFSSKLDTLKASLNRIKYSSSAVANFVFRKDAVSNLPSGMGFVIPHIENRKIIACSLTHQKFPGRLYSDNEVILRVFMGGTLNEELFQKSDDELKNIAFAEITEILKISESPIYSTFKRWSQAMPQYTLGHQKKVENFKYEFDKYANLHFLGNGFEGIGIPDMVKKARHVADKIFYPS